MRALTDYRVEAVDILGARYGLTRIWRIHTGPYGSIVAEFTSRLEALEELAALVNAAHAAPAEPPHEEDA